MNLTFQPFVDWPWLAGFAALALGVCIFLFWKRERGAWLRLAHRGLLTLPHWPIRCCTRRNASR